MFCPSVLTLNFDYVSQKGIFSGSVQNWFVTFCCFTRCCFLRPYFLSFSRGLSIQINFFRVTVIQRNCTSQWVHRKDLKLYLVYLFYKVFLFHWLSLYYLLEIYVCRFLSVLKTGKKKFTKTSSFFSSWTRHFDLDLI